MSSVGWPDSTWWDRLWRRPCSARCARWHL